MIILRDPKVEAEEFILDKKMSIVRPDGTNITLVGGINHSSHMHLKDIDLNGIKNLQIDVVSWQKGSVLEMHTGSPGGPIIAQTGIPVTDPGKPAMQHVSVPLKATSGKNDLHVVFRNNSGVLENIAYIDWIRFE